MLGVLQARSGSRRLPGKVLRPVLGRPLLALQVERLRRAETLDGLTVATTVESRDDRLAALCEDLGLPCFRGSEGDVLARVAGAAREHGAEHVVRLTGDCPLTDPALLDRVVCVHLAEGNDYTSNALERTFPDGLDVEVVRRAALEIAEREARLPSEREHVTPFLYHRPERFRLGSVTAPRDLSHHRWTVDEAVDLELVRAVYEALYPERPEFDTDDVLALVEAHPDLRALNRHVSRTAAWERSLHEDERWRGEE